MAAHVALAHDQSLLKPWKPMGLMSVLTQQVFIHSVPGSGTASEAKLLEMGLRCNKRPPHCASLARVSLPHRALPSLTVGGNRPLLTSFFLDFRTQRDHKL